MFETLEYRSSRSFFICVQAEAVSASQALTDGRLTYAEYPTERTQKVPKNANAERAVALILGETMREIINIPFIRDPEVSLFLGKIKPPGNPAPDGKKKPPDSGRFFNYADLVFFFRSFSVRYFLRRRSESGVTSTYSSSAM